ncbi:hypothetical protein Tco_0705089 [Tanacetum coccineum]|uniref:Retrotransposon gag domain-containing protein n=1 Tax=Tanacetum coccineum TaxID=301880 RepID=A0ABQ4Y559_9ASTR
MADDRPMAEQLQAPTGGFESAIVVPIINAQNFELKSSLINLVQNRIFRGGNDEEPHAHIRHFESITNNQRYPDVPNTTIKLLLFPFSLDGIFLEAWERFKELLRKCPHHGFSLMHQLDTFYNSLSYNDQDSLNSAAGGNFLYKSPNEGLQIIENKAKVRCSRNAVMRVSTNAPPTSSNSSSSFEFQQMAAALEDKMTLTFRNELNEMKNMMKSLVPTPVPIKAVEERCTTCGNNHSFNVCPMTRGPPGFNSRLPSQVARPNQGYNANQGYNGNRNVNQTNQVNQGVNSGFSQQAQAYQVPSAPTPVTYSRELYRVTRFPNPRNECKGITTRSGVVLDGPTSLPPPFVIRTMRFAKGTEVTKGQVHFNSSQDRMSPPR